MLDRALAAAGIERKAIFLPNGVKHFNNEPRGKKRLHKRPDPGEIDICRWWLDLERQFVRPAVVVALGATAIRAVTGRSSTVSSLRGRPSRLPGGETMIATIHPSYLLRMPDRAAADVEFGHFVRDLELAMRTVAGARAA